MQNYVTVLLGRDVVWHPRGCYRLSRSLAKRWPVHLLGRPMPPLTIKGPLAGEIDDASLQELLSPPEGPLFMRVSLMETLWVCRYLRAISAQQGWVVVTEPLTAAFMRLRGHRKWVWDVWEDYGANLRYDPAYQLRSRGTRSLVWWVAKGARPAGYTSAEYAYAGLFPLTWSRFLPNAFVPVENAPPLLPNLVKAYHLITGNLTESWGVWEALEETLQKPTTPLVIAGSIKTAVEEARLRQYLARHKAWLWLRSYFVPYPVVQNLQRHAGLLYGLYQPLPHIRDKIPGKFYEAAALGVPLRWREGVSPIWDAFWRRYRDDPTAPTLYWSYYEPMLLAWLAELMGESGEVLKGRDSPTEDRGGRG